MNLLQRIKKTYSYGLIFGYKRSLSEISKWLITPKRVVKSTLKKAIKTSHLQYKKRNKANYHSTNKIRLAKKYLKPVSLLPGLELIGLTGSVSANNAKLSDDIDLVIITSPNTLWVLRPFILLYLQIIGKRRRWSTLKKSQKDLFCTNLWLDIDNLAVPKKQRNLYTAHEVLQVLPLYDRGGVFNLFLTKNRWVKKYLANAYFLIKKQHRSYSLKKKYKKYYLYPFNLLLFLIQKSLMSGHYKGETVEIGKAYFHDQRFSAKVLKKHYNNF